FAPKSWSSRVTKKFDFSGVASCVRYPKVLCRSPAWKSFAAGRYCVHICAITGFSPSPRGSQAPVPPPGSVHTAGAYVVPSTVTAVGLRLYASQPLPPVLFACTTPARSKSLGTLRVIVVVSGYRRPSKSPNRYVFPPSHAGRICPPSDAPNRFWWLLARGVPFWLLVHVFAPRYEPR